MGFFKSVFKAVGKAAKWTASNVVKPAVQLAASSFPIVGPLASNLVEKLIPDASAPVQEQAAAALAEVAAQPAPATPAQAVQQAAAVKTQLIAAGVPADQASTVGSAAYAAAQLTPTAAANALSMVSNNLPNNPLQSGLTKSDVKVIIGGAIDGAKNGATDAFLDKTDEGKAAKKDAIESQGNKMLPYLALGLLGFIGYNAFKNKR